MKLPPELALILRSSTALLDHRTQHAPDSKRTPWTSAAMHSGRLARRLELDPEAASNFEPRTDRHFLDNFALDRKLSRASVNMHMV